MRRMMLLAVGLTATLAVLAVPGVTWAAGSGHFCDAKGVCVSRNGTVGDPVEGRAYANGHATLAQARRSVADFPQCANDGNGYCLEGIRSTSVEGSPIYAGTGSGQPINDIGFNFDNVCNGGSTVTSTCPFTVGSGLNTQFLGDAIFYLNYPDINSNWCVGVDTSGNVVLRNACGTGHEWVMGPDAHFVNVWYTNYYFNHVNPNQVPWYLGNDGSDGHQAFVGLYNDGSSFEWQACGLAHCG